MFDRALGTGEQEENNNIKVIEDLSEFDSLTYEEIRSICIDAYKQVCRDDLAFDMNLIPKPLRIKLLEDPVYKAKTKAIRANSFKTQIDVLQKVLNGAYTGDDTGDQSKTKLAAVSAMNDLMFKDVNNTDEEAKLNIEFIAMTREDFEKDEKVEIHYGSGSAEDFSGGEKDDKESEFKKKAKKLLDKK